MKSIELTAKKVEPGILHMELPRSKSISNRLLVMESLSAGAVRPCALSEADDTRLLGEALHSADKQLWMGHAGTALRFGLAWAALKPGTRVLRGSNRLSERPIAPLVDALRSLGADIQYLEKEGFAPLQVQGRALQGRELKLHAGLSSQFITALMLIAPYLKGGLRIQLEGAAVSRPYLHMTAALMRRAGAKLELGAAHIHVAEQPYTPCSIEVEPDWSAASYLYSLVALNPTLELYIPGLQPASLQGDAAVAEIYQAFGVHTEYVEGGAELRYRQPSTPMPHTLDFLECPDLAQTVAVTAAGLRHPLLLTGLKTLRVKETDRIAALAAELAKCGVQASAGPDYLKLESFEDVPSPAVPPAIATYHDHRMAMAFAPLALKLGKLRILDPEVVSKSFPGFWPEIKKVIQLEPQA